MTILSMGSESRGLGASGSIRLGLEEEIHAVG